MSASLEQSQQLLRESQQRQAEVQGKVTTLETQVQALTAAKEEVGNNPQPG